MEKQEELFIFQSAGVKLEKSNEFDIVPEMNRSRYGGLFFILGGLLAVGCQKSQGPSVARVGGVDITLDDLKSRLAETPSAYQQYVASAEGRRQFVNLMIREKILLIEARKAGLQHDDTYRKALDQFKVQWKQRLKDYAESLLVESYLRRLRGRDLAVPDADVKRYYDDHAADYARPVELQASHILVNTPEEAEQALARVKNGEPFEKVAREMSKDPATAAHGGRLTPFRRGTLVPEFEDAAFSLQNGQLSGVVKTQFGYHIIKKTGQTVLPPQSFEDAKEEIRARLERDKFDHWVTEKQTELGAQVNEKTMDLLTQTVPNAAPSQEPSSL
jgi:peptidyl-prolyl cis-trans isomerase C